MLRRPGKPRLLPLAAMLALIGVIALAASLFSGDPPVITGRATATDGDSLRLDGRRIRLSGIDAPEFDQTCADEGGKDWPCGRAAHRMLSDAVQRGQTRCETASRDRYGRTLARCTSAGGDLGRAMVAAGLAISDGAYRSEQFEAQAARRGIWAGHFDTPADWRAHHGEPVGFDLWGWLRSLFGN